MQIQILLHLLSYSPILSLRMSLNWVSLLAQSRVTRLDFQWKVEYVARGDLWPKYGEYESKREAEKRKKRKKERKEMRRQASRLAVCPDSDAESQTMVKPVDRIDNRRIVFLKQTQTQTQVQTRSLSQG
jgi:hypothetical protein